MIRALFYCVGYIIVLLNGLMLIASRAGRLTVGTDF